METAHSQFKHGRELLCAGQYEQAIAVFRQLASGSADLEAECYVQIALCYFNLDHAHERADPWIDRALAINPDHDGALARMVNRHAGTPAGHQYYLRLRASYRKQGFIGPEDINDGAGWDYYWSINTRNALYLAGLTDWMQDWLIEPLRARGCRTILCVGNGIHLEPRMLACAGFKVTALDLSPVATAFAASYTFTPEWLSRFEAFAHLAGQTDELAALIAAAPPVRYITGNLFDPAVCPGLYDVILTRCTLQLMKRQQLAEAVVRLLSRLIRNGVLVNFAHNAAPPPRWMIDWLARHNTLVFGRGIPFAQALQQGPDGRVVYFKHTSG